MRRRWYWLGGLGIVLAVNGFLGVGWPWTILGGVALVNAAWILGSEERRTSDPPG